MSVRNDITINWNVSPRIIEVSKDGASPTSLTIQDLYDTVRDLASKEKGLTYDEIIDAGGRETLSTTEKVVLTITLKNAKVKFEARTSWTVCEVVGGNLVALDANSQPMNPIEPSPYVNVDRAKSSSGTLVAGGAGAWDGATVEYQTTGSFGKLVADIKTNVDKLKKIMSVGQRFEDDNG